MYGEVLVAANALLLEASQQDVGGGVELTGIDRLDPNDVEEAAKMIRHLHTTITELTLNKQD
jgi:hypothetical protein